MNDPCPFGPEYQMYWNMRHLLFSKFDDAMVDAHGLYTMIPESWAKAMAACANSSTVLDVCSGIGSMSIAFALAGKTVTSVEIDDSRVAMALHNARLYDVSDKIDFRTGDITSQETLQSLPVYIDTLWFDPPWGTTVNEFRSRQIIHLSDLSLGGMDLRELTSKINCKDVLFRAPHNFNIDIFAETDCLKRKYTDSKGRVVWYYLNMTKEKFVNLPDRSN